MSALGRGGDNNAAANAAHAGVENAEGGVPATGAQWPARQAEQVSWDGSEPVLPVAPEEHSPQPGTPAGAAAAGIANATSSACNATA